MDFKNTVEFFEAVRKNKLLNIDITNYLEKLTNNEIEKLKILKVDLQYYIMEKNYFSFNLVKFPGQIANFTNAVHLQMQKDMELFLHKIFGLPTNSSPGDILAPQFVKEIIEEEGEQQQEEELQKTEEFKDNSVMIFDWDQYISQAEEYSSKTFYLELLHQKICLIIDGLEREGEVGHLNFNVKTTKEEDEIQLRDFFDSQISDSKISDIKNAAENLKGKKLAIFISLLDNKYNLINYSLSSRTNSRKNFLFCLKPEQDFSLQGVNKYFQPGTGDLNFHYENDNDYQQLDVIISNCIE